MAFNWQKIYDIFVFYPILLRLLAKMLKFHISYETLRGASFGRRTRIPHVRLDIIVFPDFLFVYLSDIEFCDFRRINLNGVRQKLMFVLIQDRLLPYIHQLIIKNWKIWKETNRTNNIHSLMK